MTATPKKNKQMPVVLGERIRRMRLDNNLSQEMLAEKVGIHRTYIGFIERGEKNITVVTAKKIADAFGITLSELFDGL